jgi:PASTA domain
MSFATSHKETPMRTRTIAALAAALSLVAAAPAAADSIAYVKDGNVWLSTPDGARQLQVTATGGYSYVSQADDGTMIALAPGERLHKLSRTGQVLADFATYVSDGAPQAGPVNRFHGPFEPTISPDGTKVAFEWAGDSYENTPGCTPSSVPPCYVYSSRQGVGITHSGRFTGPEEFGLLTGWIYPHWVSNDTLLRSYANSALNDDTVFNKVGPGVGDDQLDNWFYDQQGGQTVKDVELSRDGKTVAGIVGQGDDRLRVYRPTADPFNAPNWNHTPFFQGNVPVVQPCYEYSGPVGGRFEGLTIAPDGRHIAYGVGDGIWVSNVPDLGAGCAQATENALRIPGGRFPDWGPADVPTAKVTAPPPERRKARNRKRCTVPKLRGLKLKPARKRLARAGCKVKVRKASSRRVRRGKVMRQSAKAGKRLKRGATVTITVSRGR